MLEEFKKYVNDFYTNDENNDKMIKLKYNHSLRVKDLMAFLAKKIELTEKQIEVAKVIGLLHDYGRFYQWKNYHTFSDRESVDHALYGVKELFDKGDIKKYYQNNDYYEIIKKAIFYHNKYEVPVKSKDDSSLENDFYYLIRDADKLDILHLFEGEHSFKEEGEISPKIKEDFDKEILSKYENKKTDADSVIQTLSYIYDLNYIYSFKHLKDNKVIDKLFKRIKNKEKFKYYFDKINNYIDKEIEKW